MSNLSTCVVCGRVSSRVSWNNTVNVADGTDFGTTYVACDFHSLNEIEMAIGNTGVAANAPAPEVVNQDPAMTESPQT